MLTTEQRHAHDQVIAALAQGNACLTGGPGTGKTYTTREIVKTLRGLGFTVGAAASTNKAAAVMTGALGLDDLQATTIHKMCGLRVDDEFGAKRLTETGASKLPQFDIVLIDETSMLDDAVLDVVERQALVTDDFSDVFGDADDTALTGTRLLYIGDKNQLNPVGQPFIARPFRTPDLPRFELTRIMRQQADSNIVHLLQPIRDHIELGVPLVPGSFSRTDLHDLCITDRSTLPGHLDRLAEDDGDNLFIGWTNRVVDTMNQEIRIRRFGAQAQQQDFIPGEIVMLRAPQTVGRRIVANTGECFVVKAAQPRRKSFELDGAHTEWVRYWELEVTGHDLPFFVVDRASRANWQTVLNVKRAHALRTKEWLEYYTTQEWATDLQTRSAITSHRSQGSTYDRVVVDVADILQNPNTDEAARCLYVAGSRPRTHLTLIV